MSILPILGQTDQPAETMAFILGAIGVAGAVVAAAGALRPRSVHGPPRLDPDESPVVLWFMLLVGITVWLLIPSIYIQAKAASSQNPGGATTKPASQPLALNAHEQVELTSITEVFGLVVLLAGNVVVRPQGLRKLGLNRRSLASSAIPIAISIAAVIPIMYLAQYSTQIFLDRIGLEHPDAHPMLEIFKDQVDPRLRPGSCSGDLSCADIRGDPFPRTHADCDFAFDLAARGYPFGKMDRHSHHVSALCRGAWRNLDDAANLHSFGLPWICL